MNELKKICCDREMDEVIGFDAGDIPFRSGWYCLQCKSFVQAILRERVVKEEPYLDHIRE